MNPTFGGPLDASASRGTITIPVDEFVRTRDGVVTGLTNLIGVMNELIRSYLTHTNSLLGENSAAPDIQLNMSKLFTDVAGSIAVEGALPGGKKRKRPRKERDPNAPKRPLTSYFLYASHVRPQVKASMPGAKAKEISNEILARWTNMPEFEKTFWKETYAKNANKYHSDVAAYKARTGHDPPADEEDAPGELDFPAATAGAAIAAAHATAVESDDSEEESSEDEPMPVVPQPVVAKPKKPTKRKSKADSPSQQLLAAGGGATPAKKTKKKDSAAPDAEPAKKKAKKSTDAPAPKKDKKKKKSDA